jgi:hypothetical protein
VLLAVCWLYPPLVLGGVYATWLLGAPLGGSVISNTVGIVAAILIVTFPLLGWVMLVVSFLMTLELEDADNVRTRQRILLVVWYAGFLLCGLWDPFGALNRLFD